MFKDRGFISAVEQNYHYYPDGQSIDDGTQIEFDNPYKWSGKEWDGGLGAYDFGARLFAAADSRWTTPDPLAEKYYHISPYAYCAGDPVNLVDPDGMQWYLCIEDGIEKYVYYEGVMPKEEKAKYSSVKYLGLTYLDSKTKTYYGLFGKELPTVDADGNENINTVLNQHVDNLLISAYITRDDGVGSEDFYTGKTPNKLIDFSYDGKNFNSERGNHSTTFIPFNNTKPENSIGKIYRMPDENKITTLGGPNAYVKWKGHLLIIVNRKDNTIAVITFSQSNTAKFISARGKVLSNR